jgi:ribA/ribD-fused uncharacterized protein
VSGLFEAEEDDAIYFSRFSPEELLGSFADLSFLLEETLWPTVEHYLQAMQYDSVAEQQRIRELASPELAHKEQKARWFKRRRKDWKTLRSVYLTRAIYTRCKTHESAFNRLMDTGQIKLVENDQYDYYWGCGRDRRGTNMFGQVLMNVREKLRSDS